MSVPMTFASEPEGNPRLSVRNISKRFGTLWANRDISLDIHEAEIHAIVGENGAGKSTFAKILNGHWKPDSGEILIRGQAVRFSSPQDAFAKGIGMAYQQLLVFPQMTALDNIIVGHEPGNLGLVDRTRARATLEDLCRSVSFDLSLNAPLYDLSYAQRQQIEILRLLYRGTDVLILDEPTSLLALPETEKLLDLMRKLRASGHTVVFVSHRLREVFAVSDRISVLKRGRLVATLPTSDTSIEEVAHLIIYGDSEPSSPVRSVKMNRLEPQIIRPLSALRPVLTVQDVTTLPTGQESGLDRVSFDVLEGEVFGLGGVVGNGQRALAMLLAGLVKADYGTVHMEEKDITAISTKARVEMGIRWLPANTLEEALLPDRPLWENAYLGFQNQAHWQRYGWLNKDAIRLWVQTMCSNQHVIFGSLDESVFNLSGGNLQKLVLGRVLFGKPRLIILEQPGCGLDLEAQRRLHARIQELSGEGTSFLIISYDLDELVALSHRVGIMYRGRLMGIQTRNSIDMDRLGQWMVGVYEETDSDQ